MEKEISVKADLNGCKMVFLITPFDNCVDNLSIKAIEELKNRGVKCVKTITSGEAFYQLARAKQIHRGRIPAERKFLKLTQEGNIQLFR